MKSLEDTTSAIVGQLKKSTVLTDCQGSVITDQKGKEKAFRSARSIAELQEASGGWLESRHDDDLLMCSVCAPEASAASDTKASKPGVFRYDFQAGVTFPYAEVLPQSFRNLKDRVRKHFLGERHAHAVQKRVAEDEARSARAAQSGTVSLRVLRTGYHVLKKSQAQATFEELICLQHANGLAMGDINHSKMLMGQLRDSFSKVIIDKVKAHVLSQPCVALMADKITVNRRTLDVTAICTVVPSAPEEHMIQSLVVGGPSS